MAGAIQRDAARRVEAHCRGRSVGGAGHSRSTREVDTDAGGSDRTIFRIVALPLSAMEQCVARNR